MNRIPKRPKRLKSGDTLGIVAPASSFDREKFERGIAVIASMGFCVQIPDSLFLRDGYLAGSDQLRADGVNRMFRDSQIHGIICARGGFGSMRILPFLDIDTIRQNPKVFIGFSDISALLSVLMDQCQMVVFHGPTVTTLGDGDTLTRESFYSAICDEGVRDMRPEEPVVLSPGSANGMITGGNLTTLCHLLGTPFSPVFSGKILFLEDRNESAYRIDRMLSQMKMAGCFQGIVGVALGSFEGCGREEELHRIFNRTFRDMGIPVVAGFGIGHGRRNIVIPFGVAAELETEGARLRFFQSPTIPEKGA